MNIWDNLPLGLSPEMAISLMAMLAAAFTVGAVWLAALPPSAGTARARALQTRQKQLRRESQMPKARERLVQTIGMMSRVVDQLKLMKSKQADQAVRKLARAGIRSRDGQVIYLFAKATLPFALGIGAILFLFVLPVTDYSTATKSFLAVAAIGAGLYGPDIYLKNQADKRKLLLNRSLPDALDLMVICAEAGLSLDSAFQRVSRELSESFPEMSDELGLTAVELGFLPERRQALENLSARNDLPGLRGMVGTLMQSERYGTPLAQSLRVLAHELRNERMMKAEEKAARLPAILTVPMILFILPPLFVVLLGPAALAVIDKLLTM